MAEAGPSSAGGRKSKRKVVEEEEMEDENMQALFSERGDEVNREVRDKYWQLLGEMQNHIESETCIDMQHIQMLLLKSNELFENVKRPREAAIDAQVLKACGDLVKMNIEQSQSSLPVFKPREFAEKLRLFLLEEDDDELTREIRCNFMARLERRTAHLMKTVVGVEPLYSALEWQQPEPRARMKKKADEVTAQKKVQASAGDEEERETEAVTRKLKILKQGYQANGRKPLCFYKFIVDPESFSNTIANLFHLSLLIREMFVEVAEDENGLPVIQPTASLGKETGHDGEKQCILSMDMNEWREIIKVFNIKSAMIPKTVTSKKRK